MVECLDNFKPDFDIFKLKRILHYKHSFSQEY